jgi:ABC-type transport system involved in multi-copper enzyme maturation permease subunit
MITLIIFKELRDIIGSTRFTITFAVCSILILLTFYVGARNYQAEVASYDAARAQNLRQLEGVTDWISVRDHRVFLPPQPLAVLVSGIANDIGRTTQIQGRGEPSATDSRYGDDPVFAVFRFLDLEFLFGIVLSLLAIVYAYDAINGEKERGTLKLTFANAVPRHMYILGKLIGAFLALAVPLAIPLLLGSLLLPALGVHLNAGGWGQLALIIGAGILYFSVFLALAVFVSALTQRSSTSFLMLLVIWIFVVLIVPRSAVLLAGRAVAVPTIDDIETQKSRLAHQLWTEDRKKMSSFTPSSTGDMSAMVEEFNKLMAQLGDNRDKRLRELGDRLNEERSNAQRRQQSLALGLARLSPTTAFSLAVTTVAGTSLELQNRYHDATVAYQEVFGNFMEKKTGMKLGGRMIAIRVNSGDSEKPKPIDARELPSFDYRAAGVGELLPGAMIDFGLLIIFNIVFFAGAYAAFLRYDVR